MAKQKRKPRTTIEVSPRTREMLEVLRSKYPSIKSLDELIEVAVGRDKPNDYDKGKVIFDHLVFRFPSVWKYVKDEIRYQMTISEAKALLAQVKSIAEALKESDRLNEEGNLRLELIRSQSEIDFKEFEKEALEKTKKERRKEQ